MKVSRLERQDILIPYHELYYNSGVANSTTFLGQPLKRSLNDLWLYSELLSKERFSKIAIFSFMGDSLANYISHMQSLVILAYDVPTKLYEPAVLPESNVYYFDPSPEAAPHVGVRWYRTNPISDITEYVLNGDGFSENKSLFIVDVDRSKSEMVRTLEFIRPYTKTGDIVVVEETHLNGNPVFRHFGEGPREALETYFGAYPNDYAILDSSKFGFSFSPYGWLRKL